MSYIEENSFRDLRKLEYIDFQNNALERLQNEIVVYSRYMKIFNISNNKIQTINMDSTTVFSGSLIYDIRKNPLKSLNSRSNLKSVAGSTLYVDDFSSCCFFNDNVTCIPTQPRQVYLTCKRMFPNGVLRVLVWIIAIAAMMFNTAVCYSIIFSDVVAEIKGQNMLIVNLGVSDGIRYDDTGIS